MRRLLNQAANAAARTKGSIFEIVYRRSVARLGHNQAIGAIAHRQCRLSFRADGPRNLMKIAQRQAGQTSRR
jgi:hypothetical protein